MTTAPTEDKDALARTLELDIIFGRLFPNQRLIEDELMARFGQSRHRVRRAIDTLVLSGLAVREVNKGAHVCSYSGNEISHMYELRNILEEAAIGRIKLPVSQELIDDLWKQHAQQIAAVKAQDLPEVFQLNNAFHQTIFACCGNLVLCEAIEAQARRTQPIRALNFNNSVYLDEALVEHERMIETLQTGDLDELVLLNRAHILRPMQAYLAQYGLSSTF
ncbi:GntR family transcriptional regulator [Sulfitobacter sp. HNIBRBA3233]|uniref:GntR family transcriptional regulator n=1 Tax=Sulfitobacter marinivivus TaxID=3158558 RepID=UPI0032DEF65D